MTTEEKIIFSVQIDQSDSIDKIARLTKDINGLKEANQKLALQQGDNTKAIAENNLLIQQATNERNKEQKAVLASMEAFGKEAKSIDDARTAVKQLTIERNKLDLSTTEGRKKQTELNASIDAHNKFIKDNVDAYQQQKINIGNYTSALSGIKGPIGDFTNKLVGVKEGLTKTKDGLQTAGVGLSSLDGVIKASALGLLITIVGGLVAAFSKFEPLVEKVEFVMAGVNAAVDVLVSRFIDVGKAIM
jgi:chromosome segregation ATPase